MQFLCCLFPFFLIRLTELCSLRKRVMPASELTAICKSPSVTRGLHASLFSLLPMLRNSEMLGPCVSLLELPRQGTADQGRLQQCEFIFL